MECTVWVSITCKLIPPLWTNAAAVYMHQCITPTGHLCPRNSLKPFLRYRGWEWSANQIRSFVNEAGWRHGADAPMKGQPKNIKLPDVAKITAKLRSILSQSKHITDIVKAEETGGFTDTNTQNAVYTLWSRLAPVDVSLCGNQQTNLWDDPSVSQCNMSDVRLRLGKVCVPVHKYRILWLYVCAAFRVVWALRTPLIGLSTSCRKMPFRSWGSLEKQRTCWRCWCGRPVCVRLSLLLWACFFWERPRTSTTK